MLTIIFELKKKIWVKCSTCTTLRSVLRNNFRYVGLRRKKNHGTKLTNLTLQLL